jgi:WD40 repeat protein
MREWLNISFSSLRPQRTMTSYELNSTVPSPGSYITFIEFSPDSRFLAVGDRDSSSLYILDRSAGFHPTLSAITLDKPTSLVWETSAAFYVGLADGRFTHYQLDLKDKKLVRGGTNHTFRGVFPVTAMALDVESRTLVLSVGPEVFAFRRIYATSMFQLSTNQNNMLMLIKVNLVSPAIYRADSILRTILGG